MIYIAGHTERNVREENQDSYSIITMTTPGGVSVVCACVADGISMRAHGAQYSAAAVQAYQSRMARALSSPELQYAQKDAVVQSLGELFSTVALTVNEDVLAYARQQGLAPGGTTFSAIAAVGDTVLCANVGDSPILLFTQDETVPVYEHGTVAQVLLRQGAVTEDSPEYLLNRNRLEYFIGQPLLDHQFSTALTLADGDRVMLASDGAVYGLDGRTMHSMIMRSPITQNLCSQLIVRSAKAGSTDNQTVVVCSYIKEQTRRSVFRR